MDEKGEKVRKISEISYRMALGDDSPETWINYCQLMGIEGTPEELEEKRQEVFYE